MPRLTDERLAELERLHDGWRKLHADHSVALLTDEVADAAPVLVAAEELARHLRARLPDLIADLRDARAELVCALRRAEELERELAAERERIERERCERIMERRYYDSSATTAIRSRRPTP